MTPEQRQRALDLLVEITDTDEVLSEPDLDLFEAGLIDSLAFVELLVALDQEFGLAVSPTEVDRDEVATVNKLVDFVASRLA